LPGSSANLWGALQKRKAKAMPRKKSLKVARIQTQELYLSDAKGNLRAMLSTNPDGMPDLRFFDQEGFTRIDIFLSSDGQPMVNVNSKHGKCKIAMGVAESGEAFIAYLNDKQLPVWELELRVDSKGKVKISKRQRKWRAQG
jgi:hypothetical protein